MYGLRKIALLFIATLIIFMGCSNMDVTRHNYIFRGESELWTAEYKVDGTDSWSKVDGKLHYESEATKVLTVIYKGDVSELYSVKYLEISYDTGTGGGKLTEDHDNDAPLSQKVFTFRSEGKGELMPDKDEAIKVTINLDGDVQTIDLKNVN